MKKLKSTQVNKKFLLVVVAAFAVVGAIVIAFSKAATLTTSLTLSPAVGTYSINSNFTVSVYEDSGTQAVNAANVGLAYDQTKVQFVSIDSTGSSFPTCTEKTGGSGIVKLYCITDFFATPPVQSVTGNRLVAKITFKALAGSGTSPITFLKDYPVAGPEAKSAVYQQGSGDNTWNGVTTGGTYTFTTPDTTAPTSTVTPPTSPVSGTITIAATATDTGGSGMGKVELYVNGALKGTDTTSPYSFSFDTTTLADGTYPVYVKAYDQATPTPNNQNSPTVNMTIVNSKPDLTVTSVNLSPATPTKGNVVTVSATIRNDGTAAIAAGTSKATSFTVDGVALGTTITDTNAVAIGASYTVTATATWTATNGAHSIVATADKNAQITETNEANNSATKSITVYTLGDASGDGSVTGTDLLSVINNWGLTGRTRAQGDLTGDGLVTGADLLQVINNWTG